MTKAQNVIAAVIICLFVNVKAFAFYLDGSGNYSVRGITQTNPGFYPSGDYQTIEQYFRLMGEVRANERTSVFTEFRLFGDPRTAYLGDEQQPDECFFTPDATKPNETNTSYREGCKGAHQDSLRPGYAGLTPRVVKAYARYAFDYCIVEAGRRGRDWGMGILHDSGRGPFSTEWSVFDGLTCDVNIQKSQTLGFSIGYDKLAETGSPAFAFDDGTSTARYGANEANDDIDQIFVSILYDDTKANAGSGFTRQVGIYFANIIGDEKDINVKIADLYTGFFFNDLIFRNEVIFRLGDSTDPNLKRLGGSRTPYPDQKHSNNVQSIGFAGDVKYTMSRSGVSLGPKEYNKGNAEAHSLVFTYAYAPGDRDGYDDEFESVSTSAGTSLVPSRDKNVEAMSFHQNYKPALILFNNPSSTRSESVDGIYDASRVMNASVFSLGYLYESNDTGNFGIKLVNGRLVKSMSQFQVESYKGANDWAVGMKGKNLGFELDFTYDKNFGKDVAAGVAAGVAFPGDAFADRPGQDKKSMFGLETFLSFQW